VTLRDLQSVCWLCCAWCVIMAGVALASGQWWWAIKTAMILICASWASVAIINLRRN
jgi:hypothetical protein